VPSLIASDSGTTATRADHPTSQEAADSGAIDVEASFRVLEGRWALAPLTDLRSPLRTVPGLSCKREAITRWSHHPRQPE
jgi:hypothetical protein